MPVLTLKFTRMNPSFLHPHKQHKKLTTDAKGRHWLRIDGHMTKLPGKPPYKFSYRKKVVKVKFKGKGKNRTRIVRSGKKSGSMSSAAKKAWQTRRSRGH